MSNGLRRGLLIAVAAAAALVLVGVARLLWLAPDDGAGAGRAMIGGPFELVDHRGRTVTDADFRGRLLLVYFGYTWCPDVCPTELHTMSVALDDLGDQASQVQPLFITIDPARDDVKTMAEYVAHFHPSFVGLTGSAAQVDGAARAYRVYYAKGKAGSGEDDYLMDHSGFVYLMDRDGQYLAHFAPNTTAEEMAERIRRFL